MMENAESIWMKKFGKKLPKSESVKILQVNVLIIMVKNQIDHNDKCAKFPPIIIFLPLKSTDPNVTGPFQCNSGAVGGSGYHFRLTICSSAQLPLFFQITSHHALSLFIENLTNRPFSSPSCWISLKKNQKYL